MTMTYTLHAGQCRDAHLTADRVLALIEDATLDHDSPIIVRDSDGRECRIVADLDMECLVLWRGDEIVATGGRVSEARSRSCAA